MIGIGNTLRGDDGLAWRVVETLANRLISPEVDFLTVQQLTMDQVEPLSKVELAIFIDARQDMIPGEIQIRKIHANSLPAGYVSHFFDPGMLLAAVQALYGFHPEARLYTLSAESFAYSESFSPIVQSSLPELIMQIELDLNNILKSKSSGETY